MLVDTVSVMQYYVIALARERSACIWRSLEQKSLLCAGPPRSIAVWLQDVVYYAADLPALAAAIAAHLHLGLRQFSRGASRRGAWPHGMFSTLAEASRRPCLRRRSSPAVARRAGRRKSVNSKACCYSLEGLRAQHRGGHTVSLSPEGGHTSCPPHGRVGLWRTW